MIKFLFEQISLLAFKTLQNMATDLQVCKKWMNKQNQNVGIFGGLKPSECECMNCVNGCGNNGCLGTAFL